MSTPTWIIDEGKLVLVTEGGSRAPLGIRHVRAEVARMEQIRTPLRPSSPATLALLRAGVALWERQGNHPNRSRGPYTAELGGKYLARGKTAQFATVREARAWAADHGEQADWCDIKDRHGRRVGRHQRFGAGPDWGRAEFAP